MDIFKFSSPTSSTLLERGEFINGLRTKMWVERYGPAGEFAFESEPNAGVKEQLPVGSLISHVDTTEVMIVENHVITDQKGQEPKLQTTGRGFETYLEQRVIGMNKNYPTVTAPATYTLSAGYTWDQIVTMISDHILAAPLIDDNNALDYVSVLSQVTGVTGVNAARTVEYGNLYERLVEFLAIDNLGIKLIRPGPSTPGGVPAANLAIVVHVGVNRADKVIFSYDTGEIESAEYLWSNKALKNAAMVSGKWVETVVVPPGVTKYDRRWLYVNASDLDESLSAAPTGAALTAMIASMQQRGTAALAAQKDVALTKAEVAKTSNKFVYRQDFNVGDIVTVQGDYSTSMAQRVSEFVEIEDENGRAGYPTLTTV